MIRGLLFSIPILGALACGGAVAPSSSTEGGTKNPPSSGVVGSSGGANFPGSSDGSGATNLPPPTPGCVAKSYPPRGAECPAVYSSAVAGVTCGEPDLQCFYEEDGSYTSSDGCFRAPEIQCEPTDGGYAWVDLPPS